MKEFIEKLIGRLEKQISEVIGWNHHKVNAYSNAIRIVNQLADEYNNGWIPCSEELPPKPENNMLFENKPLELYLATVRGSDYAWRVFWNGEYFTDGWNRVDVIAWQELPKVYKSKEGEL